MYDLGPMVNWDANHQHHLDLIRQAQREKLARTVKPDAQANYNVFSPLHAILATLFNLMAR